jgi:hypothetical protein
MLATTVAGHLADREITDPTTVSRLAAQKNTRDHPMKANPETTLARARRHVIDGRQIVERQRAIIRVRETARLDSAGTRSTLKTFEEILEIFEDHLARLTPR